MAPLFSCQQIGKSYGSTTLFEGLSLSIARNERIGLIGPNGAGKSTLLKIITDLETADTGEIVKQRSLRIGYIAQEKQYPDLPVNTILAEALADAPLEDYDKETRIAIALSKVGFIDHTCKASTLSGGWRKRLSIAEQLVGDPDILLLDEPTNHLDLEGILWLEGFLRREVPTYMIISHDRAFLEAVTSTIMELNPRYPEGVFRVNGPYSAFIEHRTALFAGQEKRETGLASKMRRELEWLRQSPKARTSKSRSRIDQAHALKDELSSVRGRNLDKRADIKFAATERATRKLLTAHNLIMKYDGRTLFSGVDIVLSPGTRLGIVGINGTGKSTLLKILAGKSEPQQGTLKLADGVKIVYFDQHREQLPLDTPLRYALAENGETVYFQGRPIHVSGWAKRFLFSPDRLDQQIGTLSGGERARILIARLVLKPADILLLDEPTNDLDIETLEILEESLLTFPGAVVLITHDRLMLDGISTEIIGLGTGCDDQRFADYAQWEAFRKKKEKTTKATTTAGQAEKQAVVKEIEQKPTTESAKPKKQKLSYKEQRELAMMEERILEAEEVVEKQQKHVEDPSVIADGKKIQEAYQKLGAAQSHLDALYQRWQELEA